MDQTLLEVSNLVKYYPAPYGLFDRLLKREHRTVRAVEAFRAERNHQIFAIRGGSRIGITSFDVTLDLRCAFVNSFFPDDAPSVFVQTINAPTVF